MLGLFPTNKIAKEGGLGGLLPSLPDLTGGKTPCVRPMYYVSDDVDCRAFDAPLLLSLSGGCTKYSGQSCFLPLPEGVRLVFPLEDLSVLWR